jgi:transcriptional regulator of acetoin/glycerol metabolism
MILSPGATMVVDVLPRTTAGARATADNRSAGTDHRTLDEVERDHILAVCAACDWRINGTGNAAERLGINPNTLRSRMLKLGIVRPVGSRTRRP